jgi:hypothetical protein
MDLFLNSISQPSGGGLIIYSSMHFAQGIGVLNRISSVGSIEKNTRL